MTNLVQGPNLVVQRISTEDVRRNLFGPVDHALTDKFLKDELTKMYEDDRQRWNFNFELEQPEGGRWLWERVMPQDSSIPHVYKNMVRTTRRRTKSSNNVIQENGSCLENAKDHQVSLETLTISSHPRCGVHLQSALMVTPCMPLKLPSTPHKVRQAQAKRI